MIRRYLMRNRTIDLEKISLEKILFDLEALYHEAISDEQLTLCMKIKELQAKYLRSDDGAPEETINEEELDQKIQDLYKKIYQLQL